MTECWKICDILCWKTCKADRLNEAQCWKQSKAVCEKAVG